jgi:FHA domain
MTGWLKKLLAKVAGDPHSAIEPLVLVRTICDQVAEKIQFLPEGRKIFPANLIVVQFYAAEVEQQAALRASFEQRNELQTRIRGRLQRQGVEGVATLRIRSEILTGNPPEWANRGYHILYQTDDAPSASPLPATLTILRGRAAQSAWALKLRNQVGRGEEPQDHYGRLIQRNDVVFAECADEVNQSVSRIQARIEFDAARSVYLLFDETSTQGTFIERGGRMLTVAGVRGVALQHNDVLFFGKARARFTLDAVTNKL